MTDDKPRIHHIYDDIEEHDNQLPRWWLGILWGTMVFAVGYWLYYQTHHLGPTQLEAYRAEKAEIAARAPKAPPSDDETLLALVKDEATVKAGAQVFTTTCAACHGQKAEGLIGPNLTDKYWLHGSKPMQISATIESGVLDKGMPAWGPVLGKERVRAVTAFVLSQRGKDVPGKAPQGEPAL